MSNTEKLLKSIAEGRQYRPTAELLRSRIIRDAEGAEPEESGEMIVEGHASTFNQPYCLYDDGEFRIEEQVDPAAFEGCDMDDVIFQYNHEGRVYARTRNNTLEVSTDETGLFVRANLGGTEEGRKLYQEIQEGYTDRMSFGFTVTGDEVTRTEDREAGTTTILRTITKVGKLFDVSAVSLPANDGTDISARSFIDGAIDKLKAERLEERARIEAEKAKALALLEL